ncbi:MAG: FAD-dependent oxidoreductase [Fusobacteriaceae bacterium]|nr:FAD-dependent oxidoreductase [Fusobacteriaceae bacterium]MBN2838367.1 FAD-dependent oxidoreductase [Fusobacteriaceae bacterium]
MEQKYNILYEPAFIGSCEIKNKFAMAPMGPLGLGDSQGGFNQRGIDYYVERAKGGVGLIFTGVTFVDNTIEEHGMPNCPCSTYNDVHFVRTAREMTEKIHAYGSKIFMQLSGGFGRVTIPTNLGEFPPIAPSEIPHRWLDKTCRAITKEEIKEIVTQFGKGAFNAKRAGFDGIQIHAVHEGYLLDQFAISLFNNRTDEYGGSLENRLRFAREVVEEIKRTCGEDFPVTLRYSVKSFIKDWREGALPGEEFEEKGKDLEEGLEAAKLLVKYGYDALDVDVGTYDSWWWNHPPMYQKKGLYIPYAKMVKEIVDVPVICAGRMDNPDLAIEALNDGACDIISLGRPLLADAHYVNKLRKNGFKSIRPCLSCHEGCMGRIQEYSALNCAVNPEACRERSERLIPTNKAKKVLIIGGGVAGCEAARVLTLRGHQPVLFEKTSKLGGNLIPGGTPDFKEDDHLLADWYEYELNRLGVEVHKNKTITADEIHNFDADEIILSTGSKPKVFSLGKGDVFTASEVLLGEKETGKEVVIIGGGLVGCELALWLKEKDKNVTIIEALPKILSINGPLCHANSEMLEALIPFNNINTIGSAKAKSYDGETLIIETADGEKSIKADSVVLAVGYESEKSLFAEIKNISKDIHVIGDANRVSNIMYAIWDAYEVASNIE